MTSRENIHARAITRISTGTSQREFRQLQKRQSACRTDCLAWQMAVFLLVATYVVVSRLPQRLTPTPSPAWISTPVRFLRAMVTV